MKVQLDVHENIDEGKWITHWTFPDGREFKEMIRYPDDDEDARSADFSKLWRSMGRVIFAELNRTLPGAR